MASSLSALLSTGAFVVCFVNLVLGQAAPPEDPAAGRLIQLSDASFEHDTQAATGQTTGRWLVLFTAPNCEPCQRVEGFLQELAHKQSNGAILAKVDVKMNPAVAKRFNISAVPAVKYFRDRRMYTCQGCAGSAAEIERFVQEGFRSAPSAVVPPEPGTLDVLLTQLAHIYGEAAQYLALRPSVLACLGGVVAVGCYILTRRLLGLDKTKRRRPAAARRARKVD